MGSGARWCCYLAALGTSTPCPFSSFCFYHSGRRVTSTPTPSCPKKGLRPQPKALPLSRVRDATAPTRRSYTMVCSDHQRSGIELRNRDCDCFCSLRSRPGGHATRMYPRLYSGDPLRGHITLLLSSSHFPLAGLGGEFLNKKGKRLWGIDKFRIFAHCSRKAIFIK